MLQNRGMHTVCCHSLKARSHVRSLFSDIYLTCNKYCTLHARPVVWPVTWRLQRSSCSSHHFNYRAFIVYADPFLLHSLPITLNFIWRLTQSAMPQKHGHRTPPPPKKKDLGITTTISTRRSGCPLRPLTGAAGRRASAFNGEDWYRWQGTFLGMLVAALWGDVELLLKGPWNTIKHDGAEGISHN